MLIPVVAAVMRAGPSPYAPRAFEACPGGAPPAPPAPAARERLHVTADAVSSPAVELPNAWIGAQAAGAPRHDARPAGAGPESAGGRSGPADDGETCA